jgi:hypothetical protein
MVFTNQTLRCHKSTKRAKQIATHAGTGIEEPRSRGRGATNRVRSGPPIHRAKLSAANHRFVDAPRESVYSHTVPVHRVQVGQVWKKDDSGDAFLITKIYSEALTTFAVLRKTGSEEEPPIRIKILKSGASAILPGFTYTQESDEF